MHVILVTWRSTTPCSGLHACLTRFRPGSVQSDGRFLRTFFFFTSGRPSTCMRSPRTICSTHTRTHTHTHTHTHNMQHGLLQSATRGKEKDFRRRAYTYVAVNVCDLKQVKRRVFHDELLERHVCYEGVTGPRRVGHGWSTPKRTSAQSARRGTRHFAGQYQARVLEVQPGFFLNYVVEHDLSTQLTAPHDVPTRCGLQGQHKNSRCARRKVRSSTPSHHKSKSTGRTRAG